MAVIPDPEGGSRSINATSGLCWVNRVLQRVTDGNRTRDIAQKLFISEETVKVHVKHLLEKLGARDRTQAMAIAARRGFIQI